MCGGSVIVWVGLGFDFKAHLYVLDKTLTSAEYTLALNTCLIPLVNQVRQSSGEQPIFQHDGASAHRARATTRWLTQQNIPTLSWPARSPDLNITENLFGILAREVYRDNVHFVTREELRDAIVKAWTNLDQNTIRDLYNSLPNRIFEVITKQGGSTHY